MDISPLGQAREETGSNAKQQLGSLEAGHYSIGIHSTGHGKQREATGSNGKQQLGSLEAGHYSTGTGSGSNGKQWEATDFSPRGMT